MFFTYKPIQERQTNNSMCTTSSSTPSVKWPHPANSFSRNERDDTEREVTQKRTEKRKQNRRRHEKRNVRDWKGKGANG